MKCLQRLLALQEYLKKKISTPFWREEKDVNLAHHSAEKCKEEKQGVGTWIQTSLKVALFPDNATGCCSHVQHIII